MRERQRAGSVTGHLALTIPEADPINLGAITLPLHVTRVDSGSGGRLSFGIGVDLEAVVDHIREVFRASESDA